MAEDVTERTPPSERTGAPNDGVPGNGDRRDPTDELADGPPAQSSSNGDAEERQTSEPSPRTGARRPGGVGVGVRGRQESESEDLTGASTEEILDVRVGRGGGGGGRGGGGRSGGRSGGDFEEPSLFGRRGRSEYATRDLTKGSISKNLWFLAWPQMIEGILNVVDQMADYFWAGRYGGGELGGARAIAGLGVAQSYTHLIMTGRQGLDISMQAMIARSIGAGRLELANHVALQAFTLTGAFTFLMVLVGVFLTDPLLKLVGVSDEVVSLSSLYMRINFIGFGFQAFRMLSGGALQASGDALTPMKATLLARVTHLVISPLLFFGVWGLPNMGIAGLALANVLAQSLAVVWNLRALFTGTSRLHLTLRGYYVDFPLLWRLLRIGAPATVTGMERALVQLVLVRVVSPFGDYAVAAYGLTRRMEMFTALGSMGLGRASGTLVGQNLGAGNEQRARSTVLWALFYVTSIRGSMGLLLLIVPAAFVSIFNSEPALMEVAVVWVRIQAIGGLIMGGSMVFQWSFNVAGDTRTPLVVTLISMVLIELPLAIALSQLTPLGQYGIPVAITIGMVFRTLLYLPYFLKGKWLKVKVID